MPSTNKHALVTGSSRGIGRGIALKLADDGVNLAIHYYQNEAAAKDTLNKYESAVPMASWSKPTSAIRKRSRACSRRSRHSLGNWISS